MSLEHPLEKYIRKGALPHTFCAGCGDGMIAQSFLRAVDELGLDFKKMVFLSGIGCSGWIPSPLFDADTLHAPHGRAIAYATGIKLFKPELKVAVFVGDGDGLGIGGNHLIHAARRNIGMVVVCVNNMTYGMTGGQAGPTTPRGMVTATTPYGNLEGGFDSCELVKAAGADYVARWTTFHIRQLINSFKKALGKKGFSFIEVVSQCPTHLMRPMGFKRPSEMLIWLRDNSISIERASKLSKEELRGKIIIGEYADSDKPELSEAYAELSRRMRGR
jgi:2-oxoglutarate ferredoxin oxidoreductase subunit beta